MKIKKIEFPAKSILSQGKEKFDYADSFTGGLVGNGQNFDMTQVGKAFFTSGPKWGSKMFAFRNKMVGLFGLKTGAETDPMKEVDHFTLEIGDRVGLFKVFNKTSNEIVIGEDDKHLDFRVSLLFDKNQGGQDENSLTISTTVKFHNWLGILYFLPVRPFHKLIVPAMLKNIIGKLEAAKQ
ncbi:DUF2867 domain-containing protein [Chryseobacterium jejuense]|uniref:Protein of uncharacterized function (DUF2867) n=1 Tax=Chryseobacterium jejuense TaxID=445960 RepID=A0A2X2VEU3_CHRJE|nr:DUF2867 domain-containing protein [Chryseobacterium jejuense]SDI86090.1 Protein of unknown function [Chryseobacterium jejuense]SQB27586.1 Protein of uncharacterised function (DUF2867) [Chryseobacterium jejuense]